MAGGGRKALERGKLTRGQSQLYTLPNLWLSGPGAPAGSSCWQKIKHVFFWQSNLSYLDQPSKGDAFRNNGVHYVWLRHAEKS